VRIAQLANFYGPRSGGLRTALHHLGAGYVARGHSVLLVVPGPRAATERLPGGVLRVTLPAPRLPGCGGYRVLDPYRVQRLLARACPDHVEVSDRLTLRSLGRWAARHGASSAMISHERVDRLLAQFGCSPEQALRLADRLNARTAAEFDLVVCTTRFAQAEFDRIGAPVRRVPLGVDLEDFHPDRRDPDLRRELAQGADLLVVHCGRLSREKSPQRSLDAVATLHTAGVDVRLVVAGDGPLRRTLERRAARLPVTFLGFRSDRTAVAHLLASADVVLAPGPHETFGLAALEALACGTPAVVSGSSAAAEIVTPECGAAVADDASAFALAAARLGMVDAAAHRRAARARAERYDWSTSVGRMLAVVARSQASCGIPDRPAVGVRCSRGGADGRPGSAGQLRAATDGLDHREHGEPAGQTPDA
jgi:alpha-1,6-mannosyltransferase